MAEERFDWSDAFEDVTCEVCREILARAATRSRDTAADERLRIKQRALYPDTNGLVPERQDRLLARG